jgi:transposase
MDKVEQGACNEKPGEPLKSEQQIELERLRREVADLKMERDVLRKAAAYFAKDLK